MTRAEVRIALYRTRSVDTFRRENLNEPRMEVDEYAHEAEERIEESFREHFIYALQVAVVIYVSTILVFGTECFRVFIRYCPMI